MFTIEHGFDATNVTLVDEGESPLHEDVVINTYEDRITVTRWDPEQDVLNSVTISLSQMRDLQAALDLPEGVYQLRPSGADDG